MNKKHTSSDKDILEDIWVIAAKKEDVRMFVNNKIFTAERVAIAKARLREKLKQFNSISDDKD